MKVVLKANWYTRLGRFKRGEDGKPVDIPDELKDELPHTAVIIDDSKAAYVEAVPSEYKNPLHDADLERAASESTESIFEAWNKTKPQAKKRKA